MTITTVDKMDGITYTFYTSEQPVANGASYTFSEKAKGYVFATDSVSGKVVISTVGRANKPVDVFGKRSIVCKIGTQGSCVLNDTTYTSPGFTSCKEPECFVSVNGDQLTIEMASEGVYCVDFENLFFLKSISMNAPIKIQVDGTSGQRSFVMPSNVTRIVHEGSTEYIGNMLTLSKDGTVSGSGSGNEGTGGTVLIDKDAKIRELFYLEHADGSYTNIELTDLIIPEIPLLSSFSGVVNLLKGYRAVALQLPQIDKSMQSVDLTVTRYNEQTVTVTIPLTWLNEEQLGVYDLSIEAKHPDQETSIDFSTIPSISTIEGGKPGSIVFTKWHTALNCAFIDGCTGIINVYRDVLAIENTTSQLYRFKEGITIGSLKSIGVYMINGKVYTGPTKQTQFLTTFDGSNLTIRPKKGLVSFGTFDGIKTWTTVPTKSAVVFDASYRYMIMTTIQQKIKVDMKTFGDYDPTDVFTYSIPEETLFGFGSGQKELKDGKYSIKPSQKASRGTTIDTVAVTAVDQDGKRYTFSVTFVYEEFSRVSFVLPDNADFSSAYYQRLSFTDKTDQGFWTYGPFVGKTGGSIHAFGNEVKSGSIDSNVYPTITFSDPSSGTINSSTNALPIQALVLEEDLTIPMSPTDEYTRLNSCSSVTYTAGSLTVPKNGSLSFFRLGGTIYLLRSALRRSLSQSGSPRNLDLSGSSPTTPKAETSSPPAFALSPAPKRIVPKAALVPVSQPAAVAPTVPKPAPKIVQQTPVIIKHSATTTVATGTAATAPTSATIATAPSIAKPAAIVTASTSTAPTSATVVATAAPSIAKPTAIATAPAATSTTAATPSATVMGPAVTPSVSSTSTVGPAIRKPAAPSAKPGRPKIIHVPAVTTVPSGSTASASGAQTTTTQPHAFRGKVPTPMFQKQPPVSTKRLRA